MLRQKILRARAKQRQARHASVLRSGLDAFLPALVVFPAGSSECMFGRSKMMPRGRLAVSGGKPVSCRLTLGPGRVTLAYSRNKFARESTVNLCHSIKLS